MTKDNISPVREEFVTTSNGYRHQGCFERLSTSWEYCPKCGSKLDWGTIKRFSTGE